MMVFAKKKWGQNFLVDNNLLNKIVKTVNIASDENILEIGPGQGALSEKLVDICNELHMVEIDRDLITILNQHDKLSKTNIINQDILKFNLSSLGLNNLIVIGNIPYNITSPIIFWLVEHFNSGMGDDTANGINGFDYLAGYQSQNIYLFGQNNASTTIRTPKNNKMIPRLL